jgi:hypothetical protein
MASLVNSFHTCTGRWGISFVLGKGSSAETGSVDEILFFAHEAEEIERSMKRFREKKCILELSKLKNSGYLTKNPKQKDPLPERSRERSKDHSHRYNRSNYCTKDSKKYNSKFPDWEHRKDGDKDRQEKDSHCGNTQHHPSGKRQSRHDKYKSDKKSDKRKPPTCYSCGGVHYSTDKKCPNYRQPKPLAKMYAAREGSVNKANQEDNHQASCLKDLDQENGSDQEAAQEQLAVAHSDSEGDNPSEYGSALSDNDPNGSQYSSEGKLYNMESVYGSDSSDRSTSRFKLWERFCTLFAHSNTSHRHVTSLRTRTNLHKHREMSTNCSKLLQSHFAALRTTSDNFAALQTPSAAVYLSHRPSSTCGTPSTHSHVAI